MAIEFNPGIPIFRIYSLAKRGAFYVDFLGCEVDWGHRFARGAPVYKQVSRGEPKLHLSEGHGDGTPGTVAYVLMSRLEEIHRELIEKKYRHNPPGLEKQDWGLEMTVIEPF